MSRAVTTRTVPGPVRRSRPRSPVTSARQAPSTWRCCRLPGSGEEPGGGEVPVRRRLDRGADAERADDRRVHARRGPGGHRVVGDDRDRDRPGQDGVEGGRVGGRVPLADALAGVVALGVDDAGHRGDAGDPARTPPGGRGGRRPPRSAAPGRRRAGASSGGAWRARKSAALSRSGANGGTPTCGSPLSVDHPRAPVLGERRPRRRRAGLHAARNRHRGLLEGGEQVGEQLRAPAGAGDHARGRHRDRR